MPHAPPDSKTLPVFNINHELKLSRQVIFNRSGDSLSSFAGFGEDQKDVSVTHEVQTAGLQFLIEVIQQDVV